MLIDQNNKTTNQIPNFLILVTVLALGLWLRWRFIQTVHLYPDEFVMLLAVQMIREKGLPIMPSGLFYEHGILFAYLGSLATFLGPAQLAVRDASLLFGGLTALLVFWLGRRWFSPVVGLLAVSGLIIAPTAIHWSGRARMYALLQLLVLLTVWLAFEGVRQNKARFRWVALLTYLGATLTHFVAVAIAPPLFLAAIAIGLLRAGSGESFPNHIRISRRQLIVSGLKQWRLWLEVVALGGVLVIAFLVKRAGRPKGIEALESDAGQALNGLVQVFQIYSDFSFNVVDGWQAIAPFYLTLPALIFTPFALLLLCWTLYRINQLPLTSHTAALFLSITLLITTLEMILLVSSDRRDDKYQFMLLPILLLLGARGMALTGSWLLAAANRFFGHTLLSPNYRPIIACLFSGLIIFSTWPEVRSLLNNTGDDYEKAFAYVQDQWQLGDTILTGTPTAAALYLGRNDFYSVQRRGGYDYRILTVENQPVDRWLASPAIRTETDLHQTLSEHSVWLVLERWGVQREYYDLPFQQQLLAQTDYVTEAQGIFVLHSKANPQPIALKPARTVQAAFAGLVQLDGYTVEPEQIQPGQSLRLTLYWQALVAMPQDYTVFVHLRNEGGGNVAQADHRPLGTIYPTTLWPVGQTIRESSDLFIPADLPSGSYDLWTGLYLLETGERLAIPNDTSGENALRLGKLTIGR